MIQYCRKETECSAQLYCLKKRTEVQAMGMITMVMELHLKLCVDFLINSFTKYEIEVVAFTEPFLFIVSFRFLLFIGSTRSTASL